MSLTYKTDISYNKIETPQIHSNNVFIDKSGILTFLEDGEANVSNVSSGWPYVQGIPTLLDNSKIYDVGLISGDTNLSGMYFDDSETIVQTCEIWFTTDSTIYNITWPKDMKWIDYDDGNMPTLIPNMKYRIAIRNEITNIVASISYYYSV